MRRTRKVSRKPSASVQEEISKIGDELASLANAVGENASAETKAAINSLRQQFDSLADVAGSMMDERIKDAHDVIAENPFVAVTAAFGLGFVLAGLMRR